MLEMMRINRLRIASSVGDYQDKKVPFSGERYSSKDACIDMCQQQASDEDCSLYLGLAHARGIPVVPSTSSKRIYLALKQEADVAGEIRDATNNRTSLIGLTECYKNICNEDISSLKHLLPIKTIGIPSNVQAKDKTLKSRRSCKSELSSVLPLHYQHRSNSKYFLRDNLPPKTLQDDVVAAFGCTQGHIGQSKSRGFCSGSRRRTVSRSVGGAKSRSTAALFNTAVPHQRTIVNFNSNLPSPRLPLRNPIQRSVTFSGSAAIPCFSSDGVSAGRRVTIAAVGVEPPFVSLATLTQQSTAVNNQVLEQSADNLPTNSTTMFNPTLQPGRPELGEKDHLRAELAYRKMETLRTPLPSQCLSSSDSPSSAIQIGVEDETGHCQPVEIDETEEEAPVTGVLDDSKTKPDSPVIKRKLSIKQRVLKIKNSEEKMQSTQDNADSRREKLSALLNEHAQIVHEVSSMVTDGSGHTKVNSESDGGASPYSENRENQPL